MNTPVLFAGTYQIIRELGEGSGGTVFLAYHTRLEKNVVLKKMKTSVQDTLDIRAEVDILKNLHHPYLPQVFDFVQTTDEYGRNVIYTVMDFVPGKSFEDLLNEGVQFTSAQVVKYITQLCEAVEYLHSQNPPILHCDIKPANIMLKPDDNICLIDFNISGYKGNMEILAFTSGYAPPEQLIAARSNADKRAYETYIRTSGTYYNNTSGYYNPGDYGNAGYGTGNYSASGEYNNTGAYNNPGGYYNQNGSYTAGSQQANGQYGNYYGEGGNVNNAVPAQTVNNETSGQTTLLGENPQAVNCTAPPVQTYTGTAEAPVWNGNAGDQTAHIDQRSDIFSIGATAYRFIVGKKPDADYKKQIPISKLNIKVSDGVAFVIDKAMKYDPKDRFQTASEMLKAIKNIGKKDRRYKMLVLKEAIFCTLFILIASASVVTAFYGYNMIKSERADQFYENSLDFYERKEYEAGIKYINDEALADETIYDSVTLGNIYYIAAECSFELDNYKDAIRYYRKAIESNSSDADYYCNYAISLSKLGDVDAAEKVIEEAVSVGATDDKVSLMRAELYTAGGDMDEAVKSYTECIGSTSDPYVLARAYILYSDMYANAEGYSENESYITNNISVLEEAQEKVDEAYLPIILERLINAYRDMASIKGDISYIDPAIEASTRLIELGWGSFNNYMNLAAMYEELDEYDKARDTYSEVLKKFGENYRPYKNLALMELEIQSDLDAESRSYTQFKEYYDKAISLYESSTEQQDTDAEIQLLKESYKSVVEGGWLN